MSNFEVGQVIVLKIRYNNAGHTASSSHPYLIVDIDEGLGVIEITQLDSLTGKEFKATMRSNKTIFCDNPTKTVIDKDSYVRLDNTLRLQEFPDLVKIRRQTDKLSHEKLSGVLTEYRKYHDRNEIDGNKNVYMDESEIRQLNPYIR